ncbi:lytic transglycosylase domain-containing protein [Lysobacter gummosus]|uniref:Transglycosylase SLT domain-containing protein n=1 Tax=Lysobacter gummosus TaxID=262324 RepID=A0ABY3XHN1_9GAMM|nr:lytic transglycosylase domain-containing protein [Lysobacter gummosus]ALN90667.1 lysM domain protein [Lysobacter gummosus]UNP31153.1 transglycosylase SLT domain-containing protein [Lysobacter gummosus]
MRPARALARAASRRPLHAALAACLYLSAALPAPALAADAAQLAPPPAADPANDTGPTRNGRDIYQRFRDGLADKTCEPGVSSRWRQHFATAPKRLAAKDDDLLPLFGYVVDALREASLPTEYALIPFVESGYRPGARSASGPAGLWQMIAMTARNHRVPMREGYDGRLSPVESTQAAVRYLKTLHGMFGGDWRLTVMAYNAGEYRVLNAVKRGGQSIAATRHDDLTGLSDITTAYVRKLHALSCLMEQADDRAEWLNALDRPVPRLAAVTVPAEIDSIGEWAARTDQDSAQLLRLNPVFDNGRIVRPGGQRAPLLAVAASAIGTPGSGASGLSLAGGELFPSAAAGSDANVGAKVFSTTLAPSEAASTSASAEAPDDTDSDGKKTKAGKHVAAAPRRHTVGRGENAWTIAKRYGVRAADLLKLNGLNAKTVLKPGQALLIDGPKPGRK